MNCIRPIKFLFALLSVSFFTAHLYASDHEIFEKFASDVRYYDRALVLVVQTFDAVTKEQIIEAIEVSVVPNGAKIKKETVSTPYYFVIADYKDFKERYDFATSNEKKRLLEEYADKECSIYVEADIGKGKTVEVSVRENRKIIKYESSQDFPFYSYIICKAKYSDVFIPNTDLEDIRDYYKGPRIIRK